MIESFNLYWLAIATLTSILIIKNYKTPTEHFLGPIVKPLKALGDFAQNFPVIFGVLAEALINFVLNFIDIFLSLFDVLMWIINVPSWAVEAFMYIITAISDIITIVILWLNPITMIKGIVKLIIFLIKLIFMTLISVLMGLGRGIGESIINSFRNGLWGLPHAPENHLQHKNADKAFGRFSRMQYGLYNHHHKHRGSDFDPDDEDKIYRPMRCYRGIGANNYLNIIAIIVCPPLGVFMSYGLKGIFKILICAGLSLLYYFPGLIYALLITTHLGIGKEINAGDCGGSFGGLVVEGCPKRQTKKDCEAATIPGRKDASGNPLRACIWTHTPGEDEETVGKCYNIHLRYNEYDKMVSGSLTKEETVQDKNRFNISGNTRKELSSYQWSGDDYTDQNLPTYE